MLLIDLAEGRVISDEEVKYRIAGCRLYRKWLRTNVVTLPAACATSSPLFTEPVLDRLKGTTRLYFGGPAHPDGSYGPPRQ